jgi:hypothetical protein
LWPPVTLGLGLKHLQSPCLHVAVIVRRVEFSDGTDWAESEARQLDIWKDLLSKNNEAGCQPVADSSDKFAEAGTTWAGAPPPHSDGDTVDSYTVACPLKRLKSGKLAAACAW